MKCDLFYTNFTDINVVVAVQSLSRVQLFVPHGLQHAQLPCPSLSLEFVQTIYNKSQRK